MSSEGRSSISKFFPTWVGEPEKTMADSGKEIHPTSNAKS